MTVLKDESPMPWGKYKGDKMENVPAAYLLWLDRENKATGSVKAYIDDNIDVLHKQVKEESN